MKKYSKLKRMDKVKANEKQLRWYINLKNKNLAEKDKEIRKLGESYIKDLERYKNVILMYEEKIRSLNEKIYNKKKREACTT